MSSFHPTQAEWDSYKEALKDFSLDAASASVTWVRTTASFDRYMEGGLQTTNVTLKALVSYNAFRVWPINNPQIDGTPDNEYCHLYLNNEYLSSSGFLNSHGVFDMDPVRDRFIIQGLRYSPSGDTPISQDNKNPLFTIVILKRDTLESQEYQR